MEIVNRGATKIVSRDEKVKSRIKMRTEQGKKTFNWWINVNKVDSKIAKIMMTHGKNSSLFHLV